ncbi:guanosine-3',5'-bis(diphosphate) 3'-pyrophosphohydrolase MESH1 isoform X1 [Tympanuchus pallidicinctus]|uniref:guanosine-3',5'-bis(diphosphate) 3'-pyrophosphohydrolase MESH1 isoform X1 n=1 Tax=Tympanuchus pallidicinctus TaxID=109042 RepID=UPI0022871C67|nr:guanosine-3',5'-bis(diphosphate) 3'-pyrophosphohydrolase MESH1 isoform X1 [Tympanuchus pallidicinctus]
MGSDAARLLEAADFAAWKHREQRRKDPEGTPYINHPIGARPLSSRCPSRGPCSEAPVPLPSGQPPYGGARGAGPRPPPSPPLPVSPVPGVARILSHEAGVTDVVVLQAALLHDTVEDTDTTLPEIEERFGPEVRRVVEELTDDKTLPKAERKRLQVERAAGSSARAKLVKLADKLHNLRDLQRCAPKGWSEERVQEYFRWAAEVVAGLRGTSPPLEAALQRLLEERGVAPGPGTGQ